jgi:hypothetical protein
VPPHGQAQDAVRHDLFFTQRKAEPRHLALSAAAHQRIRAADQKQNG